ncbi:MAG: hypothetical protein QM640_10165 [Niabella sp.]
MKKCLFKRIALLLCCHLTLACQGHSQEWPTVPDVDLSKLRPADFEDSELDIPYYYKHFHTLANSMEQSGTNKGFINLAVWRKPQDNKPSNARIMENIIALAYFYHTKRPWNSYYHSEAVRVRLEAALNFWCSLQNKDGRFSEYGPQQWNLAATSFAAKFIGQTLVILKEEAQLDTLLMSRVKEAVRKAIMAGFTNKELYDYGRNYTNQYTNFWAGASAYLSVFPDKAIADLLKESITKSAADFQSPAGFFYEANGTDFGYNIGTYHSNLWITYHYYRYSELVAYCLEEEEKFCNWLQYNALKEPGSNTYFLNHAIELRQQAPVLRDYIREVPLSEKTPLLRAFQFSKQEIIQMTEKKRRLLEKNWPSVPPLQEGDPFAYNPYFFLLKELYRWAPDEAQKEAAVRKLSYLASDHFIYQKSDTRNPLVFTYVRKPAYYAAFNAGVHLGKQQRYGIGLLWNQAAGTFLQSQSNSDTLAWGTAAGDTLYEAGNINARYTIDGRVISPKPGIDQEWKTGTLSVSYPLGTQGVKTICFAQDTILVSVTHQLPFVESLPFLVGNDDALQIIRPGLAVLSKNNHAIRIIYDPASKADILRSTIRSGGKQIQVLRIASREQLSYAITLSN